MIGAALRYFLVVFASGFVLGTVRVLLVAPALGEVAAVLLELPFMLAISWLAARACVVTRVSSAGAAAGAGSVAFGLLMFAECALAVALFGKSPAGWATELVEAPGLIGLIGQLVFAAMPWLILVYRTPVGRA